MEIHNDGHHVPVFTEVTFDEFYTHYQSTWQAVKSVDPLLQFGGPGGFASIVWAADILPDFFRFAKTTAAFRILSQRRIIRIRMWKMTRIHEHFHFTGFLANNAERRPSLHAQPVHSAVSADARCRP